MLRRFTSERIRKAHRQRIVSSVALWLALALSIGALIVALVASRQIAITTVSFEGNKAIENKALFDVVAPHLDGAYFHLLSRRNAFLYPRSAIERDILERFVRIERVAVETKNLTRLVVTVDERDPAGLWCGAGASSTACYFVDEGGLAFAPAPKLTGRSFVTYEREFSTEPLGVYVESERDFREHTALIERFAELGFATRRVVWTDDALDFVASVAGSNGALVRLRVPLVGPYDEAITNLASIVAPGTADDDEEPLNVGAFDYIDLRFENKVFYKNKDERTEGRDEDVVVQ